MRYFDAVVFDCDGVLVDSEGLSTQVSQRIVADLGWNADYDTLAEAFTGCSHEYFVAEVERRIGRALEPDWMDPYHGWLEEALRAELQAIPGIKTALRCIAMPKAVASNSHRDRIELSLELVGLLECFESRISSAEDVRAGKPEPDVYLRAAEMLEVAPGRCIAVDDSRFGVTAAHRAGMFVLAYGELGVAEWLPDTRRVMEFDDMAELPRLIDRLAEAGALVPGVEW